MSRTRIPRPVRALAALGLVASLSLSACSAGSSSEESNGGKDSAVVALTGEPVNLDFTTTAGAAIPQAMMSNVYQGLVQLDQDGKIVPDLATGWDVSKDRKSYTFTLRDGVTFSDGEKFDAQAVKFSLERVKSSAWKNGLKSKMDVVKKIRVDSPTRVTVELSRPSQAWLYDMTTLVGAMFAPEGVKDLATHPVGTGPYEVTQWKRGDSIGLKARDGYWGDAPALKNITLRYFADAVATTNALRSGDVDLIYNMQAPDLLDSFQDRSKYQVVEGTSNGEVMLSMNNKKAPFDDKKVRQAVMYAIDRKAVMDTAWAGHGTLIGAPVPPTDPYYEDLNGLYPYDPAKAKELLKEAGAQNLHITFSVPTRPYATSVAEIVTSQLKDVGIDAKIKSTEFPAVWLDQVFTKHDYQMSVILAVEGRDLTTMFNTPGYYIGYDNSKIKDEVTKADESDEAGYVAGMKKVARQVMEDAAADPLFLFPNISVAKAGLEGVPANAVTDGLDLSTLSWSK